MERGVVTGGILISVSLLLAVLLNRSVDGSGSISQSHGHVGAATLIQAHPGVPAGGQAAANESSSSVRTGTSLQLSTAQAATPGSGCCVFGNADCSTRIVQP